MRLFSILATFNIFISILLAGCPKPIPTPPLPPDGSIAACATSVILTQDSVCADLFTPDGYACVRCTGGDGCVETRLQVYCIAGHAGCLGDPLCTKVAVKRRVP